MTETAIEKESRLQIVRLRTELGKLRIELEAALGEVAYWKGQAAWFKAQTKPAFRQPTPPPPQTPHGT